MSAATTTTEPILASVPDCVATHILGDTSVELSRGELVLIDAGAGASNVASRSRDVHTAPQHNEVVLILKVGEAAFPLRWNTHFGSLSDDVRAYVFAPDMSLASDAGVGGGQGGYIRIELPIGALVEGGALAKAQEDMEIVLVLCGLLHEGGGVASAGEVLGGSARDAGERVAETLQGAADSHIAQTHPTEHPLAVPQAIQSGVGSASSATYTASEWTKSAAKSVGDAAYNAGAWIGGKLKADRTDLRPVTENEFVDGVRSAVGGISDGSSSLSVAVKSNSSKVLKHDLGHDAATAYIDAGQTIANVGEVASIGVLGTAGLAVGQGAKGVVDASYVGGTEVEVSASAQGGAASVDKKLPAEPALEVDTDARG